MTEARSGPTTTGSRLKSAIVVTSVSAPNKVIRELATTSLQKGLDFFVIGDSKSPKDFRVAGCEFYSLDRQADLGWSLASKLPVGHYARKNLGYLLAADRGADLIRETDDDNFPHPNFWQDRTALITGRYVNLEGWINAYSFFSGGDRIWPRGLPLTAILNPPFKPAETNGSRIERYCPVQQSLADGDPDVDAICRLVLGPNVTFEAADPLILGPGSWCPFNSQNTLWWRDAFPLLYLPSTCTFRMTDIWRSFVAQRCLWTCGWTLAFLPASVCQQRNAHNLMSDFEQEIPGYLHNDAIRESLGSLPLAAGPEHLCDNLVRCYECLVRMTLLQPEELDLLNAWLRDISQVMERRTS